MEILEELLDPTVDENIINEEYLRFLSDVRKFDQETPFYVYSLCYPNGQPFYVGKGRDQRAGGHLTDKKISNKRKHAVIEDLKAHGSYPIIFIIEGNLDEDTAYNLEKYYVDYYGRIGFDEHGILTNIQPGGRFVQDTYNGSVLGGKIGGAKTKASNTGIFDPDWDRSKQSKLNWKNGLFNHVNFSEGGKIGGAISRDTKKGIHDPKYDDVRSDWGKKAAQACLDSGNHSGIFSKKWREDNPERYREIVENTDHSKGGKAMLGWKFWNNGTINTRSLECPGEGWVRGMIMSEKKKAQVDKWSKSNSGSGKIWVNDGIASKQIKLEELEVYLQQGWYRGRTKKKESK